MDKRILPLNDLAITKKGPVIYWMSRDQRVTSNWALTYAQSVALKQKVPLIVLFVLQMNFLSAPKSAFDFMMAGLKELFISLKELSIPLIIREGDTVKTVSSFCEHHNACMLITDFSPLRIKKEWDDQVRKTISLPFYAVDAHNVIPVWLASQKQEFSARTIRKKITSQLSLFSAMAPAVIRHPFPIALPTNTHLINSYSDNAHSGETAAQLVAQEFTSRINDYVNRNDPLKNATSHLSSYLHFGQISTAQVLNLLTPLTESPAKEQFIEEIVVRKELSENYCYYNEEYDSFNGFPKWSKNTLNAHQLDNRPYLYTLDQFEQAKTHEPLWNAAQNQMVHSGYMHGYMRMYWAKKILEWSKTAQEAQKIAIHLNDSYQLDGRDPNGYAGIAWSIGGLHDRPWFNRPIFGLVRYMNNSGAERKFDTKQYIKEWTK